MIRKRTFTRIHAPPEKLIRINSEENKDFVKESNITIYNTW